MRKSQEKQTGGGVGSHDGSEQHISQPHGALGCWMDQSGIQRRGLHAGAAQALGSRVLNRAGFNDFASLLASVDLSSLICPQTKWS